MREHVKAAAFRPAAGLIFAKPYDAINLVFTPLPYDRLD
jgi:hypothetical protein